MQLSMIQLGTLIALVSSIIALTTLLVQQRNEIREIKSVMKAQKALSHKKSHSKSRDLSLFSDNKIKKIRSPRYIVVTGLAGDGVTDDSRPIRKALREASNGDTDAVVVLPKGTFLTTKTLNIRGGVKLVGQGYGPSANSLDTDKGGSVIAYCGTSFAIRISGNSASAENLAVTDWNVGSTCSASQAAGAVVLRANATRIESSGLRNVLLYKFSAGTSLDLEAINLGRIEYTSFENVRIYEAKKAIHLRADATSYVSSNNFRDGAISGGISEVAILAEGPGYCNDNKFSGIVIEPPITSTAHVKVTGANTNVRMNDVRLVGPFMPQDKPLVIIDDSSSGNVMNGVLEDSFVQADLNRNPGITFLSRKFAAVESVPANLIWNAAFHNLNATTSNQPGWTKPAFDDDVTFAYDSSSEEYPDHNILSITYGSGQSDPFDFAPLNIQSSAMHTFLTFGTWAKTSTKGAIVSKMTDVNNKVISSGAHTGSGKWEFIGLSAEYYKSSTPQPYFTITGNVLITAPSFTYGLRPASPGAEFLSSAKAKMAGTFVVRTVEVDPPDSSIMAVPNSGNVFDVIPFASSGGTSCSDSFHTVQYLNVQFNEWFDKGTVITILFPACGGCVPCLGFESNQFFSLLGGNDFNPPSTSVHASLTIISGGNGGWREVSRNG